MDPFVSLEEFGTYLRKDVTGDELAALALDAACQTVRSYLDRQINSAESTVAIDGSGTDTVLLPEWPVSAVEAVSVDGEALAETDDDGEDNWRLGTAGMLHRVGRLRIWPAGRGNIEVTYTHGFGGADPAYDEDDVPADIRLVAMLVAKRVYAGAGATATLKQETIGNYSYTLGDAEATTGGLTDGEMRALSRYRRTA